MPPLPALQTGHVIKVSTALGFTQAGHVVMVSGDLEGWTVLRDGESAPRNSCSSMFTVQHATKPVWNASGETS